MASDGFDEIDRKLARLEGMADIIEQDVAPEVCNLMRNHAIDMVTNVWGAVDTGALRNSIQGATEIITREGETTVTMGISASKDYLRYVEFGTGVKGSAEYTATTGESYTSEGVSFQPKKDWWQHNPEYKGQFGKGNDPSGTNEWIHRFAQHPRPIMRPALYDNVEIVKEILEGSLTEEFA